MPLSADNNPVQSGKVASRCMDIAMFVLALTGAPLFWLLPMVGSPWGVELGLTDKAFTAIGGLVVMYILLMPAFAFWLFLSADRIERYFSAIKS